MSAVSSPCVAKMAPAVVAASLFQSGALSAADGGPTKLVQSCPCKGKPGLPTPAQRKVVDDQLFCAVMCCCQETPGRGENGQNLYQACVDDVFTSADEKLGWKSRYKSEISYVMDPKDSPGIPKPLMSQTSGIPTKPSSYWQGRAREQLGDGWIKGTGMVRRPDITIVSDPCKPPVQGNIERVVEMKFGNDLNDAAQNQAYEDIAGSPAKYSVMRTGGMAQGDEQTCDCSDAKQKRPVPVPLPLLSPEQQDEALRWALELEKARQLANAAALALAIGAAVTVFIETVGPWLLLLLL